MLGKSFILDHLIVIGHPKSFGANDVSGKKGTLKHCCGSFGV